MTFLWAVFIIGPDTALPLHHMPPMVYSTQAACEEEIPIDLAHVITFVDPAYHLECRAVKSMVGEPA